MGCFEGRDDDDCAGQCSGANDLDGAEGKDVHHLKLRSDLVDSEERLDSRGASLELCRLGGARHCDGPTRNRGQLRSAGERDGLPVGRAFSDCAVITRRRFATIGNQLSFRWFRRYVTGKFRTVEDRQRPSLVTLCSIPPDDVGCIFKSMEQRIR